MGRLCNVNIMINGIYGWGDGYYSISYKNCFENFFKLYKSKQNTFNVGVKRGMCNDTDIYLYGLYGGLNVHPMQIAGILETSNSWEKEFFEFQLRDLKILMEELKEWMKEMVDLEIDYEIRYSVIAMPKELYNWNEYKENK